MEKTFIIGNRTFVFDAEDKAEAAYAAKRVINGRKKRPSTSSR